jgi:hypothetical protein
MFGLVLLVAGLLYLFVTPQAKKPGILYDALVPEEQLTDSVILQIETPKGIVSMKVNRWNAKSFQQFGPETFPNFQWPQQSMYTRKVHVCMGGFGGYGMRGKFDVIDFTTLYQLFFGDLGIYREYEDFEKRWSKGDGSWEDRESDEALTDSKHPLWNLDPSWRYPKREQ